MDINAPSLRSRIVDTKWLIEELMTAEVSARREMQIIKTELARILQEQSNTYLNPHQMLVSWMVDLRIEIECIDKFPNLPLHYYDRPSTISKKFVEPIRKLESHLHHNKSKGFAAERKMIQQLRQSEREREREIARINHDDDDNNKANTQFNSVEIKHSKKQLETIIREWAEKILFVAKEMLRDSQNSAGNWRTYDELEKLKRFVRTSICRGLDGVEEAKFKQCWNLMKYENDLIQRIRIDVMKAWKRETEGYAQFKKLHEQCLRTCELKLESAGQEWRELRSQWFAANKLILELQKEQDEFINK